MAIPEAQFEQLVESISQQLAEMVEEKMKAVTKDLHESLAIFGEWFIQQQPAVDPLAFYDVILKVRSHPNRSQNPFLKKAPHPYFASVFNDVVSFFGGPETKDRIGRQFLLEASKRFAYLQMSNAPHKNLLNNGIMDLFDDSVKVSGDDRAFPPYGDHEFDLLRQLLEDIFTEHAKTTATDIPSVSFSTASDLAAIAQPKEVSIEKPEQPQKKMISSDLAEMLKRLE